MSENKEPKITAPKVYEIVDGVVPFCLHCGVKFVQPVATSYDYVCIACNKEICSHVVEFVSNKKLAKSVEKFGGITPYMVEKITIYPYYLAYKSPL